MYVFMTGRERGRLQTLFQYVYYSEKPPIRKLENCTSRLRNNRNVSVRIVTRQREINNYLIKAQQECGFCFVEGE